MVTAESLWGSWGPRLRIWFSLTEKVRGTVLRQSSPVTWQIQPTGQLRPIRCSSSVDEMPDGRSSSLRQIVFPNEDVNYGAHQRKLHGNPVKLVVQVVLRCGG